MTVLAETLAMKLSMTIRLLPLTLLLLAGAAGANDFPTVDRVNYVMECMRTHPGAHFEMVSKCSCAVDALAKQVKYADYVEMNTAANANSIGGERGSYIRDTEALQSKIKRYRELQNRAKKGCFIDVDAK
jgi:hypothetical protein